MSAENSESVEICIEGYAIGWKADPGVGPTTALAIMSMGDGPDRFKHARDVSPLIGNDQPR